MIVTCGSEKSHIISTVKMRERVILPLASAVSKTPWVTVVGVAKNTCSPVRNSGTKKTSASRKPVKAMPSMEVTHKIDTKPTENAGKKENDDGRQRASLEDRNSLQFWRRNKETGRRVRRLIPGMLFLSFFSSEVFSVRPLNRKIIMVKMYCATLISSGPTPDAMYPPGAGHMSPKAIPNERAKMRRF
jgi:hypothetical protein